MVKRGAYGPGPKLLGLAGEPEIDESVLRPRMIQWLKQCASEQGEDYVCSILRHGERHIFASVHSGQAIAINQTVLDDAPFYSKVSCRVLAAFCRAHERQEILTCHGLPGSEWPEASTPEGFDDQLQQIRKFGYLVMHDPEFDVVTVACPLFTRSGSFWGTLGSYAPYYRMGKDRQKVWVEHLRINAREMIIEHQRACRRFEAAGND
jgi:DNA-binding IclR family transcriptional regulator